jgi:hypothetical protein
VSTQCKADGKHALSATEPNASSKSMSVDTKTAMDVMDQERCKMKVSAQPAKEKDTSPLIWLVREQGIDIYKDGVLLGIIPKRHFPLLISDMALKLDR